MYGKKLDVECRNHKTAVFLLCGSRARMPPPLLSLDPGQSQCAPDRFCFQVPFKKNLAAAEKANPLEACNGSTTMADHATQLETMEEFTEDPEESPLISGCVDRGRSGTEDCGNGKTKCSSLWKPGAPVHRPFLLVAAAVVVAVLTFFATRESRTQG